MLNIFSSSCVELEKAWQETSTKIRMERDNPVCVESETNTIEKFEDLSLIYKSDFKNAIDLPEIKKGIKKSLDNRLLISLLFKLLKNAVKIFFIFF